MKKTYFGSRVLAILLTLAMVASCAGVLPLGLTASAADPSFDGYIYNGDFETGDASNWRLNDSSSVVEGGHNDSGYAIRFEGSGSWQYFRQKAYVEPDTDYRVTFWVKRVAGSGAHYIYVTNASNGSETLAAINGTKNWFTSSGDEWEQKKFEFNSGSLSQIEIYFKNSSVADVFLYDDISLAPLPKPSFDGYIHNGDFEIGDAAPWTIQSSTSSIVEGGHNDSGYAARVAGKAWTGLYQLISVQPDTDYRLTAWVKRVSGEGTQHLFPTGPKNESIAAINGTRKYFNYKDTIWVLHTVEFNSGEFTQVHINMKTEDPESVFLYDDVTLKPLPKPSYDGHIYNGDFETGDKSPWTFVKTASIVEGGHDGSGYCARLTGSAWSSINQEITVEANTDYRLTGWVKREAGSGAHHFYVQDNGVNCTWLNGTRTWFTYANPEWTQHILEFNSGNATKLKLYISIEDPESVFLYDDLLIEKLATASSDGYITNGDFETGAASGWMLNSASSIIEGGRNGSGYALRLEGSAGNTVRQSIKVDGMTDYRLTVHSKRVSTSGNNKFFVQRGDELIESLNGYDGTIDDDGTEWTEHVYEFNSGPATQITVFLQIIDNGAVFLYDDITMAPLTGPDYSHVLKGDVDLNGELAKADVTLLQQHLAGTVTLESEAAYAADMNYDGVIDEADLALLNGFFAEGNAAVLLYPTLGEEVAKGAWQVEMLLTDYTPGKSDSYSGIGNRKDQYARDDIELRWLVPQGGARSYHLLLADNPELTGAKEYLIQNNNETHQGMILQNLLVDTDYYWAIDINGVRSAVGTFHTAKTLRTLWIDGVSNTRDLGGWITEDGKYRVKYNVAFRGARFDAITADGLAAVADLGLKTDVDLRTKNEGVAAPLGDLAVHFLAGNNGAAMYYTSDASSISDLTSSYVAATVNAVRVYADASNFPAYFHCSYGRDRTGTLGLMLLGLLGVGRDDILADYEMTFLSEWGGGGISASGHTRQLINTMNWIQENYAPEGTLKEAVEGYLFDAGLNETEMAAIRANMLERIGGEPEPTGIEVTTTPTKLNYLEGKDELDVAGGKLTLYYDDGSSEEIVITADM
ncbi:MAG: tyrosine-protein phosphatase, partial [Clostridia bacterium]|nr:tyrosine-protein phosphatase [Clostridia bacterium]